MTSTDRHQRDRHNPTTPTQRTPPPDSPGGRRARPRPSQLGKAVILALVAIIGADIMDLLDTTIMNIASPVLRTDLGASTSALQWIVAGYTLAFAVMLTTGGRLGDVFGRKRMFLVGISGFLVGSVLCSLAQTSGELIGARILQGAFAAVMIPQGLGMLRAMVPAEQDELRLRHLRPDDGPGRDPRPDPGRLAGRRRPVRAELARDLPGERPGRRSSRWPSARRCCRATSTPTARPSPSWTSSACCWPPPASCCWSTRWSRAASPAGRRGCSP